MGRHKLDRKSIVADLRRAAEKIDAPRLTKPLYDEYGTFAPSTAIRHFGGWIRALKAAGLAHNATNRHETSHCPKVAQTSLKPQRGYGRPVGVRSMPYAPTSELGVAVLFGAVAQELGFAIEHVSDSFPDCLAKRRMRGKFETGWRDVAIEFEYRSSKFRDHRHDPAKCDLVVCWIHDWAACPVEVLELSKLF